MMSKPKNGTRLFGLALVDRVGSLFGRQPIYIPGHGRPGDLSIGATPDGPFGEKLMTPKDGTPWHDRVAARSLLSFSWRRPVRRAASVRVPFLLVVPDADSIAPVPAALEVARKAPGAELFRSAGGHYDVSRPSKHPAHRALHRTVAHALQEPLARLTRFCSVRCRVAAHRAGA
jgi:hypothetical protein